MKAREVLVVGGAGIGVGILASMGVFNPFSAETSDEVTAQHHELQRLDARFSTNVGTFVTSHEIALDATLTLGAHVWGTPIDIKGHKTDHYHGNFVTDANFSLNGAAEVLTSRTSLDTLPLPEDKITAQVDRSRVFFNRGRNVFNSSASTYTVKGGFVTSEDGIKVAEPERIFARDGDYTLPKSHMRGSPSYLSRVVNKVSFDNIRNGEDAYDYMAMASQVEAQNPTCIDAALKAVSFDELATASVTDELAREGYAKRNITVELVGELPAANKIVDESGKTYGDKIKELEDAVPGDQKVKSDDTCLVGNVRNTQRQHRQRSRSSGSSTQQASGTSPKNKQPKKTANSTRTQHRSSRRASR